MVGLCWEKYNMLSKANLCGIVALCYNSEEGGKYVGDASLLVEREVFGGVVSSLQRHCFESWAIVSESRWLCEGQRLGVVGLPAHR